MNKPKNKLLLLTLCASALVIQGQAGSIYRDVYTGLDGTQTVASLTNAPAYPNSPDPTYSGQLSVTYFDYPADDGMTDYGDRSQGLITAPETGQYVFWLASDDNGELLLSTDSTPAHAQVIASVPNYTGEYQFNEYPSQQSVPVTLVQGQSYYLEVLHKQAGGGDDCTVGWQTPDGLVAQPMPLSYYEPYSSANTAANITQSPQSVSATDGSLVVFTVNMEPAAQAFTYQWYKNGTAISGATLPAYQYRATMADNGAQFTVSVGGATSSAGTLSVNADTQGPTVTNIITAGYDTFVELELSESVTPASATNIAHYTMSGGISVLGATLSPDGATITLRTSPFNVNQAYYLSIANVTNYASSANVLSTNNMQITMLPGSINCELFNNVNVTDPSQLTNTVNFPNYPNSPSSMQNESELSANVTGSALGMALIGWIVPSQTDEYVFAVAGGAWTGELYLSTDATAANLSTNPIAELPGYPTFIGGGIYDEVTNQESVPIELVAGQKYFVVALTDASSLDTYANLQIGWGNGGVGPEDGDPAIVGQNLIPWYPTPVALGITSQPMSQVLQVSNLATFAVGIVGQPTYTSVQWYRNGQAIFGANSLSYTITNAALTDSATYYAIVKNLAYTLQSSNAILSVVAAQPPVASLITTIDGAAVTVAYNGVMDPTTSTNVANYSVAGATVTNATLSADGTSVTLLVSGSLAANYQVGIQNVKNLPGLTIAANTVVTGHTLANLMTNPGFETGSTTGWTDSYGTYSAVNYGQYAGSYCALVGSGSQIGQVVNGLTPNTTYTVLARFNQSPSGGTGYFFVDDYAPGASYVKSNSSTNYSQMAYTFTTGATNEYARVYYYEGGADVYCDSFYLAAAPAPHVPLAVKSVWANGDTITIAYSDYMDLPTATNLANYNIAGMTVTSATLLADGKTVTLTVNGEPAQNFALTINVVKDSCGDAPIADAVVTGYLTGNLIANPGFETGDSTGWSVSGMTVESTNVHSGNYAACLGYQSSINQTINGLLPNTTYTCSGYFSVTTGVIYFEVSKYDTSSGITINTGSTTFAPLSITFTTGATNTSAQVSAIVWPSAPGPYGYCDDFSLVAALPQSVSIRPAGGQVQVAWPAGTLYSAPALTGPWTAVPNATAPYPFTVVPGASRTMFFRSQR